MEGFVQLKLDWNGRKPEDQLWLREGGGLVITDQGKNIVTITVVEVKRYVEEDE